MLKARPGDTIEEVEREARELQEGTQIAWNSNEKD